MPRPALLERSLLYVTGKGGVGKTTVAASLGLAAARRGRRTVICEVAEQDRLSRAFEHPGAGAGGTEVELAPNLWGISIDPQQALEEWLARQLGGALGGGAFRTLLRSSAFEYFVAAAPGARELITIAKVWELAQPERWTAANRAYDLVVVDAPASGHGTAMLSTPATYSEIARVGPVRRQAGKVSALLSDPSRTGYVAVARPEEMPIAETLELGGRLREAVGLGLDAVVVNGLYPERFSAGDLRALAPHAAAPPVRAALAEAARARGQRAHLRRLRRDVDGGTAVLTLPFLFEPAVGLEQWQRLARGLERRL